jgi:hypothetical protein
VNISIIPASSSKELSIARGLTSAAVQTLRSTLAHQSRH